ncbi:RimJ/RimL family protein N-acetyltransferase [Sinobaca qinghaiensis]|uniref:RimJ/RimL family protein N-acetyltransferase n=1 Tax=Sinobaca qinghaiensis TaxID=342944 RepID=A0A419UWT5_9BACL|nr:GNAT family N-acetyltransferase [Sinobaca qinghaiensis]RKD69602.1 RimJ/RimL family protein N-acetyltransferase [Sinobaca qinghaiensis]
MKKLETERLYLRELVMEDKDALYNILSDPETMQYYPQTFDEVKVKRWIQWNMDNYQKYNHGLWAVILKNNDEFIGECGITMQEIENEIVPEIGFHIQKNYWNKGYATEAAIACRDYAFNTLNYSKIFSYTTLRNIPSQKIAKKLGMQTYKIFEKNDENQIAQIVFNTKQDKNRSK